MIFNSSIYNPNNVNPHLVYDKNGQTVEYNPNKDKFQQSTNNKRDETIKKEEEKKREEKRRNAIAKKKKSMNAYIDRIQYQYNSQREYLYNVKKQREQGIRAVMNNQISSLKSHLPQLENDYKNSAKQAYIDYMESKKVLPQQLASLGITGGVSESTLAQISTNYSNNLIGLDKDYKSSVNKVMQAIEKVKAEGYKELQENESYYENKLALEAQKAKKNIFSIKQELEELLYDD